MKKYFTAFIVIVVLIFSCSKNDNPASPDPTPVPADTSTITETITPVLSATSTFTISPTGTLTITGTPSITESSTASPTFTATPTDTPYVYVSGAFERYKSIINFAVGIQLYNTPVPDATVVLENISHAWSTTVPWDGSEYSAGTGLEYTPGDTYRITINAPSGIYGHDIAAPGGNITIADDGLLATWDNEGNSDYRRMVKPTAGNVNTGPDITSPHTILPSEYDDGWGTYRIFITAANQDVGAGLFGASYANFTIQDTNDKFINWQASATATITPTHTNTPTSTPTISPTSTPTATATNTPLTMIDNFDDGNYVNELGYNWTATCTGTGCLASVWIDSDGAVSTAHDAYLATNAGTAETGYITSQITGLNLNNYTYLAFYAKYTTANSVYTHLFRVTIYDSLGTSYAQMMFTANLDSGFWPAPVSLPLGSFSNAGPKNLIDIYADAAELRIEIIHSASDSTQLKVDQIQLVP